MTQTFKPGDHPIQIMRFIILQTLWPPSLGEQLANKQKVIYHDKGGGGGGARQNVILHDKMGAGSGKKVILYDTGG